MGSVAADILLAYGLLWVLWVAVCVWRATRGWSSPVARSLRLWNKVFMVVLLAGGVWFHLPWQAVIMGLGVYFALGIAVREIERRHLREFDAAEKTG
jgi:succinate-acetate transporter protein